ncbi:L,D-transpeptidase catalytic domain [Aquimixticola soesokkakensis]|uniref:L,D-transpeptidase catalytic domain n=1 Tax=Aquimixticola soesokkakensis TaxID=1519096 RepID=A0A1Y5TSM5_9RHOB|nr:L,D-transpeptidase family protein [Aquimixticola soesokkakensis]SLN68667.1 L,D-transpeptidase catalytic domain [Aquimixticola soesokkakensis]
MSAQDIVVTAQGARFLGRRFPCSIGRGGILPAALKREGDGATPSGTHAICAAFYRADRKARPLAWASPIGPGDLWSDDSTDAAYNQFTRAPYPFSHERLRMGVPLYDLFFVTDWNYPEATPKMGSAIFIHQWRKPRHPTAGCVAFRRDHLRWIAAHVTPRTRLIVKAR